MRPSLRSLPNSDRSSRSTAALVAGLLLVASFGAATTASAKAGGTPAGTAIVNQATATYSDGSGNNFSSTSNTVTTTVQSAPSLSITGSATQNTVPGGQLTDTFVVTNTGNGVATFTLTNPAESGNDGGSTTIAAYTATLGTGTLPSSLPTGCTATSTTSADCLTLAETNSLLALIPIAAGKTITVGVIYNLSTSAAAGTNSVPDTVITSLNGTATQAAANNPGSTGSATSAALASAVTDTDDVLGDARLDMTKAGANSGTAASPTLTYTIYGGDGGYTGAHDLSSVKALLGSSASGVFVSDAVPQFASAPLTVASLAIATSAANGYNAASATFYYTTAATPSSGWTALGAGVAPPAGATYVGVLLSGGPGGIELSANNGATTTSHVTAANAAFTLTIVTAAPTGTGSGNANAVVNQADSVIGGGETNPNGYTGVANPVPFVLGPAIPAYTNDTTSGSVDSATGTGLAYPTQAAGTASTQSGASNAVGNAALVSAVIFNGPNGNPTATGSYNGTATVNNSNDFTAISYSPTGFVPTNTSATGVTGNALASTATGSWVLFQNTLQNQGNAADNITVAVTAPSNWGVAIYSSTTTFTATGTPSAAALAGSSSSTSASYTFTNVPSGSASSTTNLVNYQVVYYPTSTATAFTTYDSIVNATSGNTPSNANTTHDDTVIGGPLALLKTQTLDPTTCTGGVAVPGCIIKYAITYTNNALPASQCPATPPSTYPSYDGGFFVKGITISENGKTGVNTWGATYTTAGGATANVTTGLNAAATDTFSSSTFTGNTVGSYAFTAAIGGATGLILAPGCSGTVNFAVTVSTS